jgi:ABC-2 type transport system permease protein
VGGQLRHDPRTVLLVLVVPAVLVTLVKYVLQGSTEFDRIGGPLLGVFPLITMFLVTSITMLRERTTGTVERLMTTPLAKIDLLTGYAAAFALLAAVQAVLVSTVAVWLLHLHDALDRTVRADCGARLAVDVAVVLGLAGLALAAGAATLRRRTP